MVSTRPLLSRSFSSCKILWRWSTQFLYRSFGDRAHKLQLVSPLFSFSINFSCLFQDQGTNLSFAFFQFYLVVSRNGKVHYSTILLFFGLSLGLVVCSRFGNQIVSQYSRKMCALHFPERILGCEYHLFMISKLISFAIPNGSSSPTNHVSSYTPFVLTYCIRLLYV